MSGNLETESDRGPAKRRRGADRAEMRIEWERTGVSVPIVRRTRSGIFSPE